MYTHGRSGKILLKVKQVKDIRHIVYYEIYVSEAERIYIYSLISMKISIQQNFIQLEGKTLLL